MKKSVKVFWSMCCALVVMGGVFTLAGLLLGMDVRAVSETFHIDEQNLEAFQEIDIAVITADIEVVYFDHYGLKADLKGKGRGSAARTSWSVSGGELKLKEKDRKTGFKDFMGAVTNQKMDWEGKVTVYLPQGAALEQAVFSVVDGDMNAEKLEAGKFSHASVSGDLHLKNCRFDSFEFNTVSGRADVEDSNLGYAEIAGVSSDLNLLRVTTSELSCDAVDGDLKFVGKPLGKTSITSMSGDVIFEIDGQRQDYEIEQAASWEGLSRVKIIDGSGGEEQSQPGKPNRIEISAMSGEAVITFR